MIAIIGGPSKDDEKGKKPGLSIGLKMKPKKVGGIGGEYANDSEDEGGMDDEQKMLEVARPLARSINNGQVTAQQIIDCVKTIIEMSESAPHEENDEPKESEDSEEGNE